jgi:Tfp pilus assembly protein PilN
VRPVNLLPQGDRARRPADAAGNGPYVVLGVLGVLLIAMLAWVLTQNQISAKRVEISRAEAQTRQAEQRAARLGAFGQFATIKETRLRSVTDLARARFDWERLMHELALVLPERTSLTEVAASTSPQEGEGTPPPPASGAAAAAEADSGPSAKLTGCSVSQRRVAILMVRLRKLYRATDVELSESAEEENTTSAPAPLPAAGAGASAGTTGCPGKTFKFETTVSFSPDTDIVPKADKRVPSALGGGA